MIAMIVARAKNNVIGKDNQLIWHLPEDLKFFKEKTSGHIIIMGRKTFESLPFLLPNREHWVITRQEGYEAAHEGIRCFPTVEAAAEAARHLSIAYIIGGAQIYEAFMPLADRLYITEIDAPVEGDTYFPTFTEAQFKEVDRSSALHSEKYDWNFTFVTYDKVDK